MKIFTGIIFMLIATINSFGQISYVFSSDVPVNFPEFRAFLQNGVEVNQ